ncbi:Putative periplasmic protein [Campylobacter jejuni subsp. doylei]|uniref:Periplasmic protein n=1 Tax=Campylobacter jejuni subsp. doylei TaxID=32021 RepID=A0A3S4U860_CAMJU|nr:Putative periplasmic protein [Campylobacter jejuni subsp. doylei]
MRYGFILFLSLVLNSNLLANNFSQKKVIKIEKSADSFEVIDLNQNVANPNLNQQKALFDSSTLIEKKSQISKDKNIDFAIVLTSRKNFGYFLDGFRVSDKEFSTSFAKNLIQSLKLNWVNSAANGIYQSPKTLSYFSPKDAKLINVSPFLRQEKDKAKMYAKFTDYVVVNLQDFYVNIINYFITTSKEGVASVNFKIISTSNGKILSAKNAKLNLKLKSQDAKQNYQDMINQMPKMLADLIKNQIFHLKLLK